ncbi:MAG: hypothetical protein GY696_20425 [Gammaproteobacteria bacterium]|nr:hypothetical protein [Gammaproteobacteria bacterium]
MTVFTKRQQWRSHRGGGGGRGVTAAGGALLQTPGAASAQECYRQIYRFGKFV